MTSTHYKVGFGPPPDWHKVAACAETDPELFFPVTGRLTAAAEMICRRCPVRTDCLDDALRAEAAGLLRFGIWGGLSAYQRTQTAAERSRAHPQKRRTILTADAVRDARARHAAGEAGISELAAEYGISRQGMRSAVVGETWTEVAA